MKNLRNRRGFTLIELIISMALVALVGLGATSIMVFGARTFRSGGAQHNLQVESRIIMEMLVADARYAVNLDIINPTEEEINILLALDADGIYSNVSPFDSYLFFDEAKQTVVKLRRSSLDRFSLSSSALNPLIFNAITPPNATTPHILKYDLQGSQGTLSNTFSLNSSIVLLNIRDRGDGILGTSGTAIRYTSPEAHLSEIHYPVIEVQDGSGDDSITIGFSVLIGDELFPREVTIESYSVDSKDKELTVGNLTFSPPPLTGFGAEYQIEFTPTGDLKKDRTQFENADEIWLNVRYGGAGEGYYLASYVLHYARQNDNDKEWQVR